MKFLPYWLDTRPAFTAGASAPLSGTADVVVIGGGFTGLSCALALAKRGANVVLLEADIVGGAASGRNGGHCHPAFFQDYAATRARYGAETTRALYRSSMRAVDTVEEIQREEGIDCAFSRPGKVKLAVSAGAYDQFRAQVDLINSEVDAGLYTLPRDEIQSEIGSEMFHGGIIFPTSGMVHVGRFTAGMATAAAGYGARIYEQTPVTGLDRLGGSRHRVTTPRGTIEAGRVVLATGISAKGPFGWVRRRIVPVGSFVIATEPLDQALIDSVFPRGRTVSVAKGLGHYYRPSHDNRILFGGRAQFAVSSPRVDAKSGEILLKSMLEIHPQLRGVRIEYCWGGMIEVTLGRFPRVGERDGLLYGLGYSGSGVQNATHMGRELARQIAGEPYTNPYRDLPWPPIPGHFGKPWFLPLVGAYYKARELAGK